MQKERFFHLHYALNPCNHDKLKASITDDYRNKTIDELREVIDTILI